MNYIARKALGWKNAITVISGESKDISVFRFHWWQPIWYLDTDKPFFERMRPGFHLSIAHAVGDEFCWNVQPSWTPDEKLPKVLQRGVVLPRYPGETFHGGIP